MIATSRIDKLGLHPIVCKPLNLEGWNCKNYDFAIPCAVSAGGSGRVARSKAPKRNLEMKDGPTMAKVIEFYIPSTFQKNGKLIPPKDRGKIIEFPVTSKKAA
jgi:hypothetical protein